MFCASFDPCFILKYYSRDCKCRRLPVRFTAIPGQHKIFVVHSTPLPAECAQDAVVSRLNLDVSLDELLAVLRATRGISFWLRQITVGKLASQHAEQEASPPVSVSSQGLQR